MAITTTSQTDLETVEIEIEEEYTGPLELTREQGIAHFEAEVQKKLGISGTEFLRRMDAGDYNDIYDDPADDFEIGYLEMLSHVVR